MDIGEGTIFGPDLPLAEAVVTVAVADLIRMEPPVCWGFLGSRCWWRCMRARMGGYLRAGAVGWCHLESDGID